MIRYITEKKFEHRNWFLFYPEEGNTRGAPTDLLRSQLQLPPIRRFQTTLCRGVEFGIETKALLYKRMCAYAGLHAIVIKGFCKVTSSKEECQSKWFVVHSGEGVQAVGGVCGQPLEKRLERSLRGRWVAPCST